MDPIAFLKQDGNFLEKVLPAFFQLSKKAGIEYSGSLGYNVGNGGKVGHVITNLTSGEIHSAPVDMTNFNPSVHSHAAGRKNSVYSPPSPRDIKVSMEKATKDTGGNRGGLSLVVEQSGVWFTSISGDLTNKLRSANFDVDAFINKYSKKFKNITGPESIEDLCQFLRKNNIVCELIPFATTE
jgi:hypothetical protein